VRRLPARTVYYGIELVDNLGWWASVSVLAVYYVQTLHLNPLELVLLGTVMEGTIFLFEVPTGVIADTFSRRASVIAGFALQGAGLALTGLVPAFAAAVAAAVIFGVGATCLSGAQEAWIADEVGRERLARTFLRGAQFGYSGAIVGVFVGVAIATVHLGAAVAAGGAISVALAAACVVVMPETAFRRRDPAERLSPIAELRSTAAAGTRLVRAQTLLLLIVAIAFFAGMASEGLDRLWEAHLIREIGLPTLAGLDPVVWFGVINAGGLAAGILLTSLLVPRFEHAGDAGLARALLALTAVLSASVVVFGLASAFALGFAAYMIARLARRIADPLFITWLNRNIDDSSVRATVISMTNQSDSIGEFAGGPVIGAVGMVASLRAALVASGALLAPALALYARALRHGGTEPEPELEQLPEPAA
jgi:DHA3 family tetracycline resistance protein-like MFS transporter